MEATYDREEKHHSDFWMIMSSVDSGSCDYLLRYFIIGPMFAKIRY